MYIPVEVSVNGNSKITVGLIDTGADETVISEKIAKELVIKPYGSYNGICASGFLIEGKYADVHVTDMKSGKNLVMKVGVSDVPFNTDDINDEGLNIILGIDFIQETGLKI